MRAAALGLCLVGGAPAGVAGCVLTASDGEDGGSCSVTATCEPEGLLLFLAWDPDAGIDWPSTAVTAYAIHPDAAAPVGFDCAMEAGNTGALTCVPRCDAQPGAALVDGRCHVPLPLPGDGDDPSTDDDLGAPLARHLEVWMEVREGLPVVRAVEVLDHELRRARLYPRTFDVAFDDGASTWSWTFAPPHVHIDASATGTFACPYEVCDGLFVDVEVSALGPVT